MLSTGGDVSATTHTVPFAWDIRYEVLKTPTCRRQCLIFTASYVYSRKGKVQDSGSRTRYNANITETLPANRRPLGVDAPY